MCSMMDERLATPRFEFRLAETPLMLPPDLREKCERAAREILADFNAYTSTDENSNRVGELALGTNVAVKDVIGQILQDEKIPGLHLAFGHPYAEHTGAKWRSSTHIDIVGRRFDVELDGVPIMKDSRFLVDEATL